jgi:stalled ribosome alternative rescue factor ArfA
MGEFRERIKGKSLGKGIYGRGAGRDDKELCEGMRPERM